LFTLQIIVYYFLSISLSLSVYLSRLPSPISLSLSLSATPPIKIILAQPKYSLPRSFLCQLGLIGFETSLGFRKSREFFRFGAKKKEKKENSFRKELQSEIRGGAVVTENERQVKKIIKKRLKIIFK
jgi:hypothetical protein